MENVSSKSVVVKKIRVTWNDGRTEFFEGKLRWYSNNLWIIDSISGNKLYVPAFNIRNIGIVDITGDNCGI